MARTRGRWLGLGLALLVGAAAWVARALPPGDPPEPPEDPCQGQPVGTPCGAEDTGACRIYQCDRQHQCSLGPAPDDRPCFDTDGNTCTLARCRGGLCQQRAALRDANASCGAFDAPGDCRRPVCTPDGVCGVSDPTDVLAPGLSADTTDPAAVQVVARTVRLQQPTAWTDCCALCESQSLEGMIPTVQGPVRRISPGRWPDRVKFCGRVLKYGVNDELADPRDFTINLAPARGFEQFTASSLKTECTDPQGDETRFKIPNGSDALCDQGACVTAAQRSPTRNSRCIHAEVTPANQFYSEDDLFLPITNQMFVSGTSSIPNPCQSGWGCSSRLESGPGHPDAMSLCVYGPYVIDHGNEHTAEEHLNTCCPMGGSHDHPEIHPFDAIWWRDPRSGHNSWDFAVFQDDSNRYSAPWCDEDNNGNQWSQGPRDVTFRFPFRWRRGEPAICPRLGPITTSRRKYNWPGAPLQDHRVLPLNVTTAQRTDVPEQKRLTSQGQAVVSVTEQAGFDRETEVHFDSCESSDLVSGYIVVRVAVGCAYGQHCSNADLKALDPGGRHDSDDSGSGYYFGELSLDRCP